MNKRIKKKWIAALLSGEYTQGTGRLCKTTVSNAKEYCCLGVLCDIFKKETGKGSWLVDNFLVDNMSSSGNLPLAVREWAGVEGDDSVMLINHNDDIFDSDDNCTKLKSHPFTDIAFLIENYL